MRFHVAKIGVFSALLVGALTACSKDDETDTNGGAEDCSNGMDDDGDGDVDTQDSDCSSGGDEETVCDDGEDDDGDGDVDCDDDDCEFEDACVESDCGNGTDDDGDGDIDCDDRDCNGESECEFLTIDYYAGEGGFGYNETSGNVEAAYVGGEAILPYVVFIFATADYLQTGDDTLACSVVFQYEGADPITYEVFVDEGYGITHGGFVADLSNPDWVGYTDCTADEGKRIDPDQVGDDAIAWVQSTFTELGTGMGVTNDDVQGILDGAGLGDDLQYFGGGGVYTTKASDGVGVYTSANYGFGYAVDADMNLLDDGAGNNVLLLATDFDDPSGQVPMGYFRNAALYFGDFAEL